MRENLSNDSMCIDIAGSLTNADFFEDYLGMRVESVDEVEIIRRSTEEIYNKEEYKPSVVKLC